VSFGTFNTVKYALYTEYAYITIVFSSNSGSAGFWPKMDPIRPKITQNVLNSFPIYVMLLLHYIIALKAHWKAVAGRKLPKKVKNGNFCNRIIRPNFFNLVKYALNTIRRIRQMSHFWVQTWEVAEEVISRPAKFWQAQLSTSPGDAYLKVLSHLLCCLWRVDPAPETLAGSLVPLRGQSCLGGRNVTWIYVSHKEQEWDLSDYPLKQCFR